MLTNAQIQIIDTYVSPELFDVEKLKKYLNTHDMVGNEVFAYCDLGKSDRDDRGNHSYSRWLDDEYGFNPVSTATFVRRVPFYFYVSNFKDIRLFGNLGTAVHSIYDRQMTENPDALEQVYVELEFLFYEKRFQLTQIFSYLVDQYGLVTAPFLSWAKYIHLCDDLGWDDYFPESFISKYNMALEAAGEDPIIYEVEDPSVSGDMFFRNGKMMEFSGQFPMDEEGKPVLRWTNIKVKNPASITCKQEKSRDHSSLTIELSPRTIIYGKNFYDSWKKDVWYQIYAGPLFMEFDYDSIKDKRKRLGFTQQEVADAIGTTVRTYQKWESGETTPDGHYLLRLMNWLDLPDPQYVISYTDGES